MSKKEKDKFDLVNYLVIFKKFFLILAATSTVVFIILINPFIWFLLRVLTGISMVCIYTVAESWLNDRSSNKNRGSVLSIYMVILYGSMGIGMFLLNFSTPKNFEPFILVSVITSVALIPILLTKKKPPTFKKINVMSFSELYKSSGLEGLQKALSRVDPAYYKKVDHFNTRRLIRALEVFETAQKPYSSFLGKSNKNRFFKSQTLLLTRPRSQLYKLINKRVEKMTKQGLEYYF